MAEMVIARQLATGKRAIYVSPLKAVTAEKHDEWTDKTHPFASKRLCIMTGDFSGGETRDKEMAAADIVLLTSEMLDSKSRKSGGKRESWLDNIGVCVVDEAHLLGTDRGPALEAGLMRITEECPDMRLVFLSATMPNIAEVQRWMTSLNGIPTVVVDLPWRPVELRMHWLPYAHSGNPRVSDERYDAVQEIVNRHKHGSTLVFVHTKRMGRQMCDMLRKRGITCEFHSGELDKTTRTSIERRFRSGELPVLISTSTLAWGCNL
jgi:replicative superfamily II helicase